MTATEKHYTVEQIADLWSVSAATVRRMFRDVPGVLKINAHRSSLNSRAYESLRIPASIVARLHEQRSSGFSLGGKVQRVRRGI